MSVLGAVEFVSVCPDDALTAVFSFSAAFCAFLRAKAAAIAACLRCLSSSGDKVTAPAEFIPSFFLRASAAAIAALRAVSDRLFADLSFSAFLAASSFCFAIRARAA